MDKTEKFINEFKFDSNIIFSGMPWVGKTHIMKKLFEKLPENQGGLNKYWIDDGEFRENITSWKMVLRPFDAVWCPILSYPLEVMIRVKVLFYDDLGASENVSEAQKTKFKFILDEREKKGLITIYSTNLTPKELSNLYGERIKSRIFNWKHKKGLLTIQIDGEDRRRENIKRLTL